MTIRRKSIRRILMLAAAVGVTTSVITATFIVRRHARESELADARSTGMIAYESRNFAGAMPPLQTYVTARPDDVEALYALACAQAATQTPGRDNLLEARSRFQQVLVRKPDHIGARRHLMQIYEQTGLSREMLAAADAIIAAVPNDTDAMRCRALSLGKTERYADAVTAWDAYLALNPKDVAAQELLLTAMRQAGQSPEAIIAHAQAGIDAHPGDDRFRLPLASALRDAGREDEARKILESLASKPQTDAEFVVALVGALDRTRAFDVAERTLAQSADALNSGTLSTALIERMWQNGRHAQVISTTDRLLAAGRSEAGLLALRALSLSELGRRDEAMALVTRLAAMPSDPSAAAWNDALAVEFRKPPLAPNAQVQSLRDALSRDPDNGIVYAWLGRALALTNDVEGAARCYREAAQRLPSWPAPCVELSQLALSIGRTADAAAAAKAAYLRSPGAIEVQIQVARVHFAELQSQPDAAAEAALLKGIIDLRAKLLNDARAQAALAPMQVALLARQGRTADADDALRAALLAKPSAGTLVELYDVARRNNLAGADAAFDRASADGLLTPRMAILRAAELASGPRGLAAAIAFARSQGEAHPGEANWALVEAHVRQSLGDPGAADAWKRSVAAFPSDVKIQSAALAEAAPYFPDRVQQAAIVERLKVLCGESSLPYRIARARYLAGSPDEAEARQALTLAADLVRQQPGEGELRVLLARVLLRLDSSSTAIEHLRVAYEGSPGDVNLALELAATLRRTGRADDALAVLRRVANLNIEESGARARVAQALSELGAYDDAASLLAAAAARRPLDSVSALLYAESLAAKGDVAAADRAFDALVADAEASPGILASAAAFERRQGRIDRAEPLLARVDRSTASAADRARALARYAISFGEFDRARAAYAAGMSDSAADVALHYEAIEFEASQGKLDAAATLLARAETRYPNEPQLVQAKLDLAARKAGDAHDDSKLDALIASMAADPSSRPELEALRALRDARSAGRPTPELATRLTRLSELYPASFELARAAIDAAVATDQQQPAQEVALRLLSAEPPRLDAVALATQTLAQLQQVPAARRAAQRWREMTKADPRDADVMLARLDLADGEADAAAARLTPYAASIQWDRDTILVSTLAEAKRRLGRGDESLGMLEPELARRPAARAIWADTAVGLSDASVALAALIKLEAATPADATDERVRLGAGYLALAQRAELSDATRRGIALLQPLDASGRLVGGTKVLMAELQRVAGDSTAAQATLREALKSEPANASAKNSLAYLLLADKSHGDEAARLAAEAVAAAPTQAEFRDTLARTEWAAGRLDRAATEFGEALRLKPNSLDALIGLAHLQTQRGETANAQATIRRIDLQLTRDSQKSVPLHLRGEWQGLRQAVTSAPAELPAP